MILLSSRSRWSSSSPKKNKSFLFWSYWTAEKSQAFSPSLTRLSVCLSVIYWLGGQILDLDGLTNETSFLVWYLVLHSFLHTSLYHRKNPVLRWRIILNIVVWISISASFSRSHSLSQPATHYSAKKIQLKPGRKEKDWGKWHIACLR